MAGWSDLLLHWQLHPLAATAILGYAIAYRRGLERLRLRSGPAARVHRRANGEPNRPVGRRWPTGRTLAFAGSLVAATLATQSGVARYEHHSFTAHMVQHTLLALLVPLLVVLSAPLTLALQTWPERSRRRLRRALHGSPGRLLTHPLVGWSLFGGGLVALYLTPLLDLAAENHLVHLAVHAHMMLAGVLFLAPLVGTDAFASRLPHPARLLALLTAVPFHTVVAVALLTATSPVAPEAYPDLDDQREAAAVFWGTGELLTLAASGIVVRQWWLADQRAIRREAPVSRAN